MFNMKIICESVQIDLNTKHVLQRDYRTSSRERFVIGGFSYVRVNKKQIAVSCYVAPSNFFDRVKSVEFSLNIGYIGSPDYNSNAAGNDYVPTEYQEYGSSGFQPITNANHGSNSGANAVASAGANANANFNTNGGVNSNANANANSNANAVSNSDASATSYYSPQYAPIDTAANTNANAKSTWNNGRGALSGYYTPGTFQTNADAIASADAKANSISGTRPPGGYYSPGGLQSNAGAIADANAKSNYIGGTGSSKGYYSPETTQNNAGVNANSKSNRGRESPVGYYSPGNIQSNAASASEALVIPQRRPPETLIGSPYRFEGYNRGIHALPPVYAPPAYPPPMYHHHHHHHHGRPQVIVHPMSPTRQPPQIPHPPPNNGDTLIPVVVMKEPVYGRPMYPRPDLEPGPEPETVVIVLEESPQHGQGELVRTEIGRCTVDLQLMWHACG